MLVFSLVSHVYSVVLAGVPLTLLGFSLVLLPASVVLLGYRMCVFIDFSLVLPIRFPKMENLLTDAGVMGGVHAARPQETPRT